MEESMPKPEDTKTFEWYKTVLELGNYEAEFGAKRFHEAVTHHLAIAGSILALAAFAISQDRPVIFALCVLVSLLGTLNACLWRREMEASRRWTIRWRKAAAFIEAEVELRKAVQSKANVFAMSREDKIQRLIEDKKPKEHWWKEAFSYLSWSDRPNPTPQDSTVPESTEAAVDASKLADGGSFESELSKMKTFWDGKRLGTYATRWTKTAWSFSMLYVSLLIVSTLFLIPGVRAWIGVIPKKPEPSTSFVFLTGSTNLLPLAHYSFTIVPTNSVPSTNVLIIVTQTNEPPAIKVVPKSRVELS